MTDFLQDHPDGQLLAPDEMSLYFQSTTRQWSLVDPTPIVRVSPQRDPTHFQGALNVVSGHEFALPASEMTSETPAHFLRDLLLAYPTQPILRLWDRANGHEGDAVKTLLANHRRLEPVFFPPACPDLNPQEHVWSQARAAVSHNHTGSHFLSSRRLFCAIYPIPCFGSMGEPNLLPLHGVYSYSVPHQFPSKVNALIARRRRL